MTKIPVFDASEAVAVLAMRMTCRGTIELLIEEPALIRLLKVGMVLEMPPHCVVGGNRIPVKDFLPPLQIVDIDYSAGVIELGHQTDAN